MGAPTIRDVAVAADVAIGTVSRVLNGHKSVSDDVRRRVLKAIKKLKYEPDRVAQSMRLGVTRTVAFATRDISIPGFGAIVNAAEEALRNSGYTLLLTMTDERKDRELNLLRIFQQRRVDAVIMTISNENDAELTKQIRGLDIPIVLLDREKPPQLDAVTLDHRRGVRAATEYLHGLGHTRIALLTGKPSTRPAHERIAGFKEASARLGRQASHSVVRTGAFSAEFGFREASSLLSAPNRPTAIIAGGMAMLAGVLKAIRARGLSIPGDVSVVAGADSDLAALATPSVTAVRWSGTDEGRMAVQLLLNRLGNRSAPVQRVMLSTELITRGILRPAAQVTAQPAGSGNVSLTLCELGCSLRAVFTGTSSMSGATRKQARSWMFVPGNRERFIRKANGSAADAILLDIEDGVLPNEKGEARRMIAAALAEAKGGPRRYVRVNALTTPWLKADLEAVIAPSLEGICLTKVTKPSDVHETASLIEILEKKRGLEPGTIRILAAVESARGLMNAVAIADSSPRIVGLMFGAEDYALDLGLGARREKEAAELLFARSQIVNAAAAANVLSIDGVFPNLNDEQGLEADVRQARRLGFTSKSTFNPRQIDMINTVFSPQPDEIEYARKIAAGFREAEARGDASVAVGGQLVDRPIVLRALKILEIVDA